ncbi:D-threonine aldolase [Bhargavaea cecembensis DSE10]|uniref:D-threonine aldolase n=1 Tax=Bhargavaea cecembensis DSE10 TaxID=1235279 RepID=M7NJI6_9BACL|nr:D-TA family PLP-dependent enzyme [Bhargavaea cecembensis]EMR07291.1 D-threonine aldolase [Bhargavaea cecembensis DSE10]
MNVKELDTPALLIDQEILLENIRSMQAYADANGVKLRPHTKTHKMPVVAKMQEKAGASGITVAKTGEAEVMAARGLNNIFIANQVVGKTKLERVRKLAETIDISFGVDSPVQIRQIEEVFRGAQKPAQVLVEIEVGEKRSGVIEEADFHELLKEIRSSEHVRFRGVFSHDGHTYKAESAEQCRELFEEASARTLRFAEIAREAGMEPETVSIGSTPPFLLGFNIPEGITEIRPGTYVFMDASQSNVLGDYGRCAATILTTIISKPTRERVITDVGAKGITAQTRTAGITATKGLGKIKEFDDVFVDGVFDEHAIIYNEGFSRQVEIGDKVRIIPNHICPVCNLHERAWLVSGDGVVDEIPVEARGKLN